MVVVKLSLRTRYGVPMMTRIEDGIRITFRRKNVLGDIFIWYNSMPTVSTWPSPVDNFWPK